MPLKNAKHEAVLQAYIADPERVGWRAYKSVYRKSSQRAAETAWSRLLKIAEFSARHDELLGTIALAAVSGAVMDLNEVLAELSKLGRANMQDFIVAGDNTTDVIAALHDLPREQAAAIQELAVETYVEGAGEDAREVKRVKLKLHDKRGSLAELRRHFVPQKHEVDLGNKDGKPFKTESEPLSELEVARRIAFALEQGARAAPQEKD